jgi:bifunctional non-homologous end joining protein LigD
MRVATVTMAGRPAARSGAPLSRSNEKRDFEVTREPPGTARRAKARRDRALAFVVQKHRASRLHYDFRLELDGVLLSWAVPKGPSFDPSEKRTAIHVEDHPVSYGGFEGGIPAGAYGAGTVIVWDRGTWEPVGDAGAGLRGGKLLFRLHGRKLAGLWELVRIAKPGDRQDRWILFKKPDEWARPRADYDVVAALPDSVVAHPLALAEEREPRQATSPAPDPAREPDLANAKAAALPGSLAPQLATLATAPPAGGRWLVENKFDGYRLLARIDSRGVRLVTRGGHDWTARMHPLATAVRALGIASGWLDGEIVVLDEHGLPDFNALQNAIDAGGAADIVFFVFDAPFLDGMDLRRVPLWSRRLLLQRAMQDRAGESVRFSQEFALPPAKMLEAACRLGLEGIIVKQEDAPYVGARTDTWLKLKCSQRQEFVVVGFTDRAGAKGEVGGLLLAYHEDGRLRYAGSVGTGWDAATGRRLHQQLQRIEVDRPALEAGTIKPGRWSRRTAGSERWVQPRLVAEVAFTEWTPDGHVRHPTFKGLRDDKPVAAITREATVQASAVAAPARAASVRVSNPERVIDASSGFTKVDLVRYYESVAAWMVPHLAGRPISLVRAPEGLSGDLFFHKHASTKMPGLKELGGNLWPGHGDLLGVDTPDALVAAAQMNTIELHTWNSTTADIDHPDRVVFDLDPGEGVGWPQVQEAAILTRALLNELGLASWPKTSGGKGLHVVVPLLPEFDYDVVRDFSQAVVRHMARTIPDRFVAKAGAANRVGRIFIDWMRNGHGQTTVSAFSARARPGLGVSMTVGWDEVPVLKGGAQWTVATAREELSFRKVDPWAGYWEAKQPLGPAMKKLGFRPARR